MPARMGNIVRAAKQLGLRVVEGKGTSHWKFERDGHRPYPIPAHNGEKQEISDKYIRGMCRALGLDENELRKLL